MVGTMPDQTLFDAAKANRLGTATEIEAQARRMVADPKLRGSMLEFHRQWLELDRLEREASKDPTLYPTFTAALKNAVREESDRFVAAVMVDGDGSLRALLTSPTTFVNADLAKLYGVAAPASGWAAATLKPAERAGILTRANFLASHAHALSGSPPLRAVAIMRRLMCTSLPPPPGDADTSPPKPQPGDAPKTNRQLFEARTAGSCQGCHGIIDPLGFGLENYDAIGGYRTMDNGFAVNAAGIIKGTDVDGPFTGGVELSQKLAASKTVASCAAKTWFEYGIGRDVGTADACRLAKLNLALSEAGGDVRELLVSLVKSPEFIYRTPIAP
jgi:mono/diheme cytochrome c family protein